jgi:hypothetical protein
VELVSAGVAGIDLPEGLKRDVDLINGHPKPGITHFEDHGPICSPVQGDDNRTGLLGKFERVGDQIEKDLLEPRRIAYDRRHLVLDFGRQADPTGNRVTAH